MPRGDKQAHTHCEKESRHFDSKIRQQFVAA